MPIPSRGPTRRIAAAPLSPLSPIGVDEQRDRVGRWRQRALGAAADRGRVGRD